MSSPTASPISQTFARLRAAGRMAFMPFIAAGDPDLATTKTILAELAEIGVDLIEVGFPYSDPIADGPVIQAAYTRALAQHVHVAEIFRAIRELTVSWQGRQAAPPPLVAMVAYAIVYRQGPEAFAQAARDAGFAGLIVPDLPADEAAEFARQTRQQGLDLIELIAPTTTPERAQRILETSSGFIYCISVTGTTGIRDRLPSELATQLKWLRSQTRLPLAVGFGVNQPEQVAELRGVADGVIVGSALVRHVAAIAESKASVAAAVANVKSLATAMVDAAHRTIS
ncbi:MAG: tryptophan synthase subunit alpha [Planctomycetaceae bacterium]